MTVVAVFDAPVDQSVDDGVYAKAVHRYVMNGVSLNPHWKVLAVKNGVAVAAGTSESMKGMVDLSRDFGVEHDLPTFVWQGGRISPLKCS